MWGIKLESLISLADLSCLQPGCILYVTSNDHKEAMLEVKMEVIIKSSHKYVMWGIKLREFDILS